MFEFNGRYDDQEQVAPFLGEFARVRAEIIARTGRHFAYDDEFIERIPAIANKAPRGRNAGTHEETAIYLLQTLYRAWEQEARLLDLRAEGFEDLIEITGTTAPFARVVVYSKDRYVGPYQEFETARLVTRTAEPGVVGAPYALLPKRARTRGHLLNGRAVLVLRKRR